MGESGFYNLTLQYRFKNAEGICAKVLQRMDSVAAF